MVKYHKPCLTTSEFSFTLFQGASKHTPFGEYHKSDQLGIQSKRVLTPLWSATVMIPLTLSQPRFCPYFLMSLTNNPLVSQEEGLLRKPLNNVTSAASQVWTASAERHWSADHSQQSPGPCSSPQCSSPQCSHSQPPPYQPPWSASHWLVLTFLCAAKWEPQQLSAEVWQEVLRLQLPQLTVPTAADSVCIILWM